MRRDGFEDVLRDVRLGAAINGTLGVAEEVVPLKRLPFTCGLSPHKSRIPISRRPHYGPLAEEGRRNTQSSRARGEVMEWEVAQDAEVGGRAPESP